MKKASIITLLSVLLSGCSSVTVSRILADPAHYRNRSVTVHGRVTNVVGAMNAGLYEVNDGTGTIYVISGQGVPNRDASVKVSGTVTPGVNIMGRSIGTAIKETSHKVRY